MNKKIDLKTALMTAAFIGVFIFGAIVGGCYNGNFEKDTNINTGFVDTPKPSDATTDARDATDAELEKLRELLLHEYEINNRIIERENSH